MSRDQFMLLALNDEQLLRVQKQRVRNECARRIEALMPVGKQLNLMRAGQTGDERFAQIDIIIECNNVMTGKGNTPGMLDAMTRDNLIKFDPVKGW